MDVSYLLSGLAGGLLVFAAQWLAIRRQTQNEDKKTKWEARREHWKSVCAFRHDRMAPVFEAIDTLSRRWDVDEYFHLVESLGLSSTDSSEHDETPEQAAKRQEQLRETRAEYESKLYRVVSGGISSAGLIGDDNTCAIVRSALYANADPDCRPSNAPSLTDAHEALEKWVYPDVASYLGERP